MFLNASHRIVLFSSKVMSLCNFGPHNATLSSYFAEPLNESSVGMCFKNVPSPYKLQRKYFFLIFFECKLLNCRFPV